MTNSGNKPWKIEYHPKIKKDVSRIHNPECFAIERIFCEKIAENPAEWGVPLRRSLHGFYKIRVGDYRIVYRADVNTQTVFVLAITHRSVVYQTAKKRLEV